MAVITFTIPSQHVNRVLEAFSGLYSYQEQVINPDFNPAQPESTGNPRLIDNPISVAQFSREQITSYIINNVQSYETIKAKKLAEQGVIIDFTIDSSG